MRISRARATLFALAVSLVAANLAFAQNYRPFTSLRALRTEHFEIIFPEESRRTAEALAGFADETYERVSGLLGIELRGRVPVAVTPHTDEFNGYMNPFPYPHIVLFDTPMDPEWTTFRDSLEGLFLHELTHAVSMSSRGPFSEFLHGIFGGWVMPSMLNAPLFMLEGVTVSFESLEGYGRANDPLVRELVRQARLEGKALTPFQASGMYDYPPFGSYYEYGGLFSAYLQSEYGMEKYAELWKAVGSSLKLSLSLEKSGVYGVFREVYGVKLTDAWEGFLSSLDLDGVEDNAGLTARAGESIISGLDSGGGRVFRLDRVAKDISAYRPSDGSWERVLTLSGDASDFDVSDDGSTVLVAGYRYAGALATAIVEEFDVASGKATGRSWKGLRKPRYFRDGVVGVGSDLHATRIVYRDGAGGERVLLEGDGARLFSAPAPVDADRIAFIVADSGDRRIGVYDFVTGEARLLESDLADDGARWRYARGLRATAGKLYFSYDHDDRLYKLASLDLMADGGAATFSGRDFSGGVFSPVEVDGTIFYRGAFSTWDALMRFPEDADDLSGEKAALRYVPLPAGRPSRATGSDSRPEPVESAYFPLKYMNPLSLWFPYPIVRMGADTFRVDGFMITSFMGTPTDGDTILLSAGYDAVGNMAVVDLTWRGLGLGLPVSARLADSIEYRAETDLDDPYRDTRFSVQAEFSKAIARGRASMTLAPIFEAVLVADELSGSSTAYDWDYSDPSFAAGLRAGLSTLTRPSWRLFGAGLSLDAYARVSLPSASWRYDATLRAASELLSLPIRATVYGSWDELGMAIDGSSTLYGAAPYDSAAVKEYADEAPGGLRWVAGAEVELAALSFDVQSNISHLYFNRLFGVIGWRGTLYGADGATVSGPEHSIVAKAGSVISALPVGLAPLRLSPYAWAALKLSNLANDDPEDDWGFGLSLELEW